MAPAILPVLALLALLLLLWCFLFLWCFVFEVQRRPAVAENRQRGVFERGLRYLGTDWTGTAALARTCLDGGPDDPRLIDRKERARSCLRRIVALTGATQVGNTYLLKVGTTQFSVRDGYVRRMRDTTDPKCRYEETCFCSANADIPRVEQIATVLLQLKNNPALFDGWATRHSQAFKADGQAFTIAR